MGNGRPTPLAFFLVSAGSRSGHPQRIRIVAPGEKYNYRDTLQQSRIIGYALGNCTGALIPFAFACFVARRQWFALSLLGGLSLLFYTVTITKFSLALPFYLGFIAILASRYEARSVVILLLLIPIVVALFSRDFDSGIPQASGSAAAGAG